VKSIVTSLLNSKPPFQAAFRRSQKHWPATNHMLEIRPVSRREMPNWILALAFMICAASGFERPWILESPLNQDFQILQPRLAMPLNMPLDIQSQILSHHESQPTFMWPSWLVARPPRQSHRPSHSQFDLQRQNSHQKVVHMPSSLLHTHTQIDRSFGRLVLTDAITGTPKVYQQNC